MRSEGISAAVALPVKALGKTLGVVYADCTRDGAVLSAEDLQRVAFCARMLATALGNRVLVSSLLDRDQKEVEHWALASKSAACAEFTQRVKLYAPADYTVLLRGETGTGKEVVARALHELSRRAKGPFVPVNCAAIPEQLMESMLFGHEKGSFTGAMQARRGHFEEAHGGTILLDEIGDMAVELQAKILRVLQDRVVVPIGSRRQVRVDVAHRRSDAPRPREDGARRAVSPGPLLPPPRTGDRAAFAARTQRGHLGTRHALPRRGGRGAGLRGRARNCLQTPPSGCSSTPGPATSASSATLSRVPHCARGGEAIRVVDLDLDRPGLAQPTASPPPQQQGLALAAADGEDAATWKERLEAQERAVLQRTYAEANGNLTRAAELFGVPRTTYREKLVRHGLLEA